MGQQQPHPVFTDFKVFMAYVWKNLGLPEPTEVQNSIADYIQDNTKKSKMVQAFRGVGKSWITSAYVCWCLLRNPQLKILVVSASKQRSDAFSTFTKRLINTLPLLAHLKATDEQRDTMIAFDVGPAAPAHAPSVKSVGITGQLTGSRADIIIADDIESLNNSMTLVGRDRLLELIKEFSAIIVPGGEILYLGTPQSHESVYNTLPERGYDVRVWPAEYPKMEAVSKYSGVVAPYIVSRLQNGQAATGQPVDPKRFPEGILGRSKLEYGKAGYALQFMLDTSLSDMDKYPLKLNDLIVFDCDKEITPVRLAWSSLKEHWINQWFIGMPGDHFCKPLFVSEEWEKYTGSVMVIDPSGRGNDETAYAVVKMYKGRLHLVASGGFKEGYSENTLVGLADIARIHNVQWILDEVNFGDRMFVELLKPVLARIHPECTIDPDGFRSSTQKERRIIDTLRPVLESHRLVVDSKVIENDLKNIEDYSKNFSLFYQMSRLTYDKGSLRHDDRLDALAIAVNYWTDQMSRDLDKLMLNHKEAMLEEAARDFLSTVDSFMLKTDPEYYQHQAGGALQW